MSQQNQQAAKKSLNTPKQPAKKAIKKSAIILSTINSPNVAHDAMDDAAVRLSAAQSNDQAWLVRLTGFSTANAVTDAMNKLQKMGLPAYTYQNGSSEHHSSNGLQLSVGPFVDKSEAVKDLSKIKKTLKLNGTVIEFNPTELK